MQEGNQIVSVLINTRNRDRLIPRAIHSALNQTYKNLEIVVIDGASTDNTKEVILGFADARIKYFYSPVATGTDCWKLGLSKCHGDYIALLDDDDEWLPEKIHKQVALFNFLDNSYGWIGCSGDLYDDVKCNTVGTVIPFLRGYIHEQLLENAGKGISGGSTLMFRKDALTSADNPIANIAYSTDFLISLWLSKSYKYDYCDEVLCIGHINHIYEHTRASKLQPTAANFIKMIQWNQFILSTYHDTLSRNPSYKYLYLRNLALIYAQQGDIKRTIKFTLHSVIAAPGRWRKNASLLIKAISTYVNRGEQP